MNRFIFSRVGSLLLAVALPPAIAAPCLAQQGPPGQRDPHVGYVYPAGARRGEITRIEVGGQFLDGVDDVLLSGGGVRVKVIGLDQPLSGKELSEVRLKLQEARDKLREQGRRGGRFNEFAAAQKMAIEAGLTVEQIQKFREMMKSRNDPKIQSNPQLAEIATLEIEIDPGAKLGRREFRLVAGGRLSNPLVFYVEDLPEYNEKEPNDDDPAEEIEKALPFVINGQILPGDVDRFAFQAAKDEPLVVASAARDLMPHLADAVPGWFQATLALYDSEGNEVAYADDYRFNPDPVLYYRIPKAGTYTLEIKDAIYRGREDFVYRLTLGRLPFVTSVFPLGGPAGEKTTVEVRGVNLPETTLTVAPGKDELGLRELTEIAGKRLANRVPFAVDDLREIREEEPNDSTDHAQTVSSRIIVNARIDSPGDRDVYAFESIAGRRMIAEIRARRLNSPLDSVLQVTDAQGNRVAVNDDHEDKSSGTITHHADSWVAFTIPTNGTCYLTVGDIQSGGGEAFAYRLYLHPRRADFALRVVPSAVNAPPGATVPITVYALRQDGFDGEIALGLKDAPKGFELSGARIPPGEDSIRMTLSLPPRRLEGPIRLEMEGAAHVDGRPVRRRAVPAEDMMQAFIYRHLVPAESWLVSNVGQGRPRPPLRLAEPGPVKVPAKGSALVRFATGFGGRGGLPREEFEFELSEAPGGLSVERSDVSGGNLELRLSDRTGELQPGTQGNLIVTAFVSREIRRPGTETIQKRRFPVGVLPAIPYRIVP